MNTTKTFHGPWHRVQLRAYDLDGVVKFVVYALPSHFHKATAFRRNGTQVYFGTDAEAAWAGVLKHAPRAERPGFLAAVSM